MKLHANMCISGLKHAQEILIIDISTSNMSFLQYLEVKIPYPTYISWKPPTTNRNPHLWWKYRIPRFHYKSSTDVGLKGDLGLLVMTRQLVVYILLFVGWVSTNSTSRCISQYRPWLHLSPVYAFRPITMANMKSCDPALPIICKVNESLNPYIKSRIPQSPCPSIKLKTNSIC